MNIHSESLCNNRLEVLNISNINAQGVLVLNDEKLLELIQQYPFIFNSRVFGFKDEDYTLWAWNNITTTFNRAYEQAQLQISFTSKDLKQRWQILQPIIKSLSKAYDASAIPQSLRQIVSKISGQLDDPLGPQLITLTEAQSIILENIPIVEKISFPLLKRLEAEMMELILSAEFETKINNELKPSELEECENEYRTVLNAMKLRELVADNNDDNDDEAENDSRILLEDGEENNIEITYAESTQPSTNFTTLSTKTVVIDDISLSPTTFENSELLSYNMNESNLNPKETLLMPLEEKKWIPMNQVGFYIRPCVVRIKRTILEDDLPLAHIKRERKW